ncbi:unnamed protein product [Lampetra planeri]
MWAWLQAASQGRARPRAQRTLLPPQAPTAHTIIHCRQAVAAAHTIIHYRQAAAAAEHTIHFRQAPTAHTIIHCRQAAATAAAAHTIAAGSSNSTYHSLQTSSSTYHHSL